jgi:predicted membrane-bound mannosyltransferase
MLLDKEKFNKMKQIGVGKDSEKIKERLKAVWLPLKRPQREEILTLAGLSKHAASSSYENGSISLKLTLAVAQTQQINPYYLTGASDDKDDYSEEVVKQFLTEHKHGDLTIEEKPKRKYERRPKPEAVPAAPADEAIAAVPNANDSAENEAAAVPEPEAVNEAPPAAVPATLPAAPDLSAKKAKKLLKSLYMRAEYCDEARQVLSAVKNLLVK